ncbi:5419_t:CDS:2, partial [Entrophospora sp. SA101]
MTAVLRSIEYLEFTVPDKCNTHVYFKKVEAKFLAVETLFKFSIKKIPSSITSFCKYLLGTCETFEGSTIRLLDSTIFLEHKFSEFLQNISGVKDNEEILPKISNEKQTMEDNEEALSNKNKFDMMNI